MCWCAPTTHQWSLISTTKVVCARAPCTDPCVGPRETPLIDSGIYPWASQYGSRSPVETGAEARGMDASPRCGEENLESVWPGSGGPLRYSGDWGWMLWYRHGRGFVCTPFPRSLCSLEFWRECAGMRSVYFW